MFGPRGRDRAVLEGRTGEALLPLNDGRFLRFSMSLFLEGREDNTRLKVEKSVYQYQLDPDGEHWIVRYDYLRYPEEPHPGAHVQIRGSLTETAVTPVRGTLERIHFPTGRVSIEAVIRMLVEQFGVPTNEDAGVWRPILSCSEEEFLKIARQGISGPGA